MDNIVHLQNPTTKWRNNVKSCYELIDEFEQPLKIRLVNCPWEGIVYVYTKIEAGNEPDKSGLIPTKFDYCILDESQDFSMEMFKLDVQMMEFELMLGRILKDILTDLAEQESNDANNRD